MPLSEAKFIGKFHLLLGLILLYFSICAEWVKDFQLYITTFTKRALFIYHAEYTILNTTTC